MLLDDIETYLTAMGAVSPSWPIRKGILVDDTDQAIAIFETGGYPADTLGRENLNPTFLVQIRGPRLDYLATRNKWQEVFDILQDAQQSAGSPTLLPGYYMVQAMHDSPRSIGTDDKGRPNLVMNFRVKKSRF